MNKTRFIFLLLFIIGTGCSPKPSPSDITQTESPASTITQSHHNSATSTIHTLTPPPSTTLTPTSTPKIEETSTSGYVVEPVDGICLANSNVRSFPGRGGEDLGGVIFGNNLKVWARNPAGNWYYISFAGSPTGKAWVHESSVFVKGYVDLLPIAIEDANHQVSLIPPIRWSIFDTPQALPTISNDQNQNLGLTSSKAEVRVCPTNSCMIISYLNPGEKIILDGREGNDDWARILYPSGPDGRGWISTNFLAIEQTSFLNLPYFDYLGTPVTPEPPTNTPDPNFSPTPTQTSTPTPAGPLAEITNQTTVYALQSSFSPILGTLYIGEKINITAESLNKLWYEIQYPFDSLNRGYISTKFVRKLGDFRYLHYTDSNGTPVPTP